MTNILENIIIELFNNNIIQFNNDNNFVFNFNDMLSLSYITNNIIKLIVTKLEHININYIIGISSFSKHICSIIAHKYNYKLLMFRNNINNTLDGIINNNDNTNLVIIDDLLYKGNKLDKFINILNKNKLNITHIITLFDYKLNNSNNTLDNYNIHSLLNIYTLLNIINKKKIIDIPLFNNNKFITNDNYSSIHNNLLNIIKNKKTNICLHLQLSNYTTIIQNIEKWGKNICILIINSNIIKNFTKEYGLALAKLSQNYNFILINDLKLSSILELNLEHLNWSNVFTLNHFKNYNELNLNLNYLQINTIDNNYLDTIYNYNIFGHINNECYYSKNVLNFSNPINDINELNCNINNYDIITTHELTNSLYNEITTHFNNYY